MQKYKTVIVEDDSFAREMLIELLSLHSGNFEVVAVFETVNSALKSLNDFSPDLVFLDLELSDGKGFDILEQLPGINFEIIITTMHDSYMLQAIKHSALDYILKPITAVSLGDAIGRFEKRITEQNKSGKEKVKSRLNKIILPMSDGLLLLNISEIIRLESDGSYTKFVTTGGKKYVTSRSIGFYESQLESLSFFRVHHSHMINMNHIDRYVKGEGGYVVMSDKSSVDVSRRKKDEFLKALTE